MKLPDANVAKIKEMFDTDLLAVISLTKEAAPFLEKSKGSVINISSNLSMKVIVGTMAYGSLKAALNHLTKALAVELGPTGIRVNTIW